MKLHFTLSRLECDVQCLTRRIVFFENTINSECYIDIILEFLGNITEEKISKVQFLQDRATCHTAWVTVLWLSLLFRDKIILKGLRSQCLLGLSPPDIFLRACTKDSSYHNNSHNLDELNTIVSSISPSIVQAVSVNMLFGAQLCKDPAGEHFQNFCNKIYFKHLTLNRVLV
jgi:hypothetical protein